MALDRLAPWFGAGAVTAAVVAATIAGAGAAGAETESDSSTGTSSSSASSSADVSETDADAHTGAAGDSDDADGSSDADDMDGADETLARDSTAAIEEAEKDLAAFEDLAAVEPTTLDIAEELAEQAEQSKDRSDAHARVAAETLAISDDGPPETLFEDVTDEVTGELADDGTDELADPADTRDSAARTASPGDLDVDAAEIAETATPAPTATRSASAAASPPAAMAAPKPPSPINVVGTLIFNLLAGAIRLFDPPVVIPAGSNVTLGRSTLSIPAGDGIDVEARWYFPDTDEPVGLIYAQHALFRNNSNLSALAIQLAERTNSIVVAPTVTSNFFETNGFWINGDPMHRAVAGLFTDPERAALEASATAAAIDAGLLLPGQALALPKPFVLAGHSAGGNLVSAVAGYVAEDTTAVGDLRGVVLLDGVDNGTAIGNGVATLPEDMPVYQVASVDSISNAFGAGTKALEGARPGQFIGVLLERSSHVDAEGPSSGILAPLVAGFPKPRNVAAVQAIAAGWINDALAGSRDQGLYGAAGQEIPVNTDDGTAIAVVLGEPERVSAARAVELTQQPAAYKPTLLNVLGALVFGLYDTVFRLFEGPAMLPPGSTVTVQSATLQIDCGDGYEAPADWYFPADPEPTRLIYLQHGFMASAPIYSYTAAFLAESTNSIVVAPSLTSNFLACDSCWLGGAPMHQAVAELFDGDRAALTASAVAAAGYELTLPTRFVLAGHSAGGGLALATAAAMSDTQISNTAGILLLDGVALGSVTPAVFDEIPMDLPILQLGAPAYGWNTFGDTSLGLVEARGGQFNGVELVGGTHIDTMQGGNPLFQFVAYLIAGFSHHDNIEAAHILASGWVEDMFDETQEGIYGTPGEPILIPTSTGTATATALPASESDLSALEQVLKPLFLGALRFVFGLGAPIGPAVTTSGGPGDGPEDSPENSPENSLVSDGESEKSRPNAA